MFDQAPRRFHPRQTTNQTDAQGCLICPDDATNGCNCAFNQQCILINRYDLPCSPSYLGPQLNMRPRPSSAIAIHALI